MEWADKEKIRMAIVALHVEGSYYRALDLLCDMVDWKSFRHEGGFYPGSEMDAWVRSKSGITSPAPSVEIAPDPLPLPTDLSWYQRRKANFVGPRRPKGWPKGRPRKVVLAV